MNDLKYGSDLMVGMLDHLGLEYVALNPGASFRGIHDSLVSAGRPELILTLHENVAVAVAHGYAKSAGRPMGVILHNLVGLQSGAMGIFNAWADQVPILVLGGSGPADAARRPPWIVWVHSARLQSLVVRDQLKWDDQPTSLEAVPASIMRAHQIASTVPYGPTYVSLDVLLQEMEMPPGLTLPPNAPLPASTYSAPQDTLEELVDLLTRAERPVIVADFVGKSRVAYEALVHLAELLAVPVVDMQGRHNFPTGHWADGTPDRQGLLESADMVLALDLRDLMHGIGETDHDSHTYAPLVPSTATVISMSTNQMLLSGFIDYCAPHADIREIIADTAAALPAMVDIVRDKEPDTRARRDRLMEQAAARPPRARAVPTGSGSISSQDLSLAVAASVSDGAWQIANGHLRGAVRDTWDLTTFNAHLGRNTGGGLGFGIGVSMGAALAHRGDETVIVNLQNDGDLLYTPQGLWTAARYGLPVLNIVVNNRSYGQDRMHQSIIAGARGRDVSGASVGIDIDKPDVDFTALARSQGVEAFGPVTDRDQLVATLTRAVAALRSDRRPVVVDVRVPR